MDDELPDLEIESPAAHRALAHPMRHRLLMALRGQPATMSQLARSLDARKGSIAHHLNVLVEAGMVRAAEVRQVRGGTEQYYEPAVGRIVTRGGDAESTAAMLSAVATSMTTDEGSLLHLRHVRLTEPQAAALRDALEAIVADAPDTPDQSTYGVLVGLYRR